MEEKKEDQLVAMSQLEQQRIYMSEIRKKNDDYEKNTGQKKKFHSVVMGCQMNVHDSEKLEGMLDEMGYIKTDIETDADFIIYNTCCVRENAEMKVYGKLGWLKQYKKDKPKTIIALCGCMTQQESVIQKLQKSYRHVDIVFGTFNLYKLPELITTRMKSNRAVYDIWQEHKEIVEDLPSIRQHPFKSCVNIMFGCDNFCTYCIVPYVRGRERSRVPEDIMGEIKKLVADGVKEITLLGQNVNSYGKTLEEPMTFGELLRLVNTIEGLERIRFTTSHPKDLSDDLIEAMVACSKVCKNLHLPFQSGSTKVLKAMNRKYSKEEYLESVRKIREKIPFITFSTDIMVGFPEETEEDFQETLDVISQVGYSMAYTYFYSKRTGTPAAIMENQIPKDVAKDRFDRMFKVVNAKALELNTKQVGTTVEVLVEDVTRRNPTILTGRADNNTLVHFEGNEDLIGEIVPLKVIENKTFYLIAERI